MMSLIKRVVLFGVCAIAVLALTQAVATAGGGQSGGGGEPPGFACEDLAGQLQFVGPPFRGLATVTKIDNLHASASGIGLEQLGSPTCTLNFTAGNILLGVDFDKIKPANINGMCSTEGNAIAGSCAQAIQACGSAGGFQVLGSSIPRYSQDGTQFTTELVVMCVIQR